MKQLSNIIGLTLTAACMFMLATPTTAQRHEIFTDNIASLQVMANDDWQSMPVVELNKGEVTISFDDLTHEYHRYAYKVAHCEADWSLSEGLFANDYVDGFAEGNTIDDVQESLLTNTLYTHYTFRLPNEKCRLKMSGNYRITVYDDNDDERPVLTACIMVVDKKVGLALNVTTNTDIDVNNAHQQVGMELKYNGLNVTDPARQLKTVVMQNSRWDQARLNVKPQYVMPDGLRWDHCRDYIFNGGNEYRKFEILSTDVASMGVERIGWDGEDYHAYPFAGMARPYYIYDEDANGAFLLRNSDNQDGHFTSDYMWVHFRLQVPHPPVGNIYLNGAWTYDRFLPQYRMEYDADTKTYEAVVRLKLGYYSYQYVLVNEAGQTTTVPSEGNFYQTENRYQALVYYREPGGRTDYLVGYQQIAFEPGR